jgi:hypothetical protein
MARTDEIHLVRGEYLPDRVPDLVQVGGPEHCLAGAGGGLSALGPTTH